MLASPAWFLAGWSGVAGDERFRGVRGGWNLDPPVVAVACANTARLVLTADRPERDAARARENFVDDDDGDDAQP